MQLNDLLGFQLAEAEQRLKQDGLGFRVEVSKAPRAADPQDSSQLRVARARREGELIVLTVVHPPALELPE